MKKVLFISPTPTHPANAGNRVHIKSLVTFFKEQNFDVHFLYLAYENYDEKAMRSFFGSHFTILDRDRIYNNKKTPAYILWKLHIELDRFKRKMQLASKKITRDQYKYNGETDNYFSVFAVTKIKELQKEEKFEIVVCEYASMSRSLTYFGKDVYKILDTHDRFTDRFSLYLKNGMKPEWVSLYKDQEKKALDRADLVIALQNEEKKYFQSISNTLAIRFFRMPEIKALPARNFEKKIMYFASGNKINNRTLEYFETEILPLLKSRYPEVRLLVGGSICTIYKKLDKQIDLLGAFDNPSDFYSLGDIVINPENNGTGFKIKTLEALCYGLPVVCTTSGASGLLEPFMDHLLLADGKEEFVNALGLLFENEKKREQLKKNATNWVNKMNEKLANDLLNNLPKN